MQVFLRTVKQIDESLDQIQDSRDAETLIKCEIETEPVSLK